VMRAGMQLQETHKSSGIRQNSKSGEILQLH